MKWQHTIAASLFAGAAFVAFPILANAAAAPAANVQKAFKSAKVSLAEAIANVQKETSGTITHAVFEMQSGKPGYDILVYTGGKMQEMWVDPATGKASKVTKPSAADKTIETQDHADMSSLMGAKATLYQAVGLAEKHAGGKALEAALAKHNTAVAISVDVLKDGKLATLWVNPKAGTLES